MAGTKVLSNTSQEPMYDTGGSGRRMRGWTPGLSGPNSSIIYGAAEMRNRSRDLSRKFPLLAGAYGTISSNIVEAGIRALPKADSKQDRLVIKDTWEVWQRECDSEGIHSFPILQDLLVRERYEAGEIFIRHRPVSADEGLLVPYQIQILEAEHIPYEMNEMTPEGNIIIAGIEFNPTGRRVAYHVYPDHPGDGIIYKSDMKTIRVPASEIIHYYKVLRSGQVRGIPECFAAQAKSRDVMVYNEAELVKKQTASLMTGFITSPDSDPLNANADDVDADPGEAVAKMEPGSIMALDPGELITFNNPVESGASYDPFMKRTYSEIASALNMSYEEFSLDVSGISFSSIRAVLNQSQRKYKQEQVRFIDMVLMPIWKKFFETAVMAGVFDFPDYIDTPRKYTRVLFQPPGWAYVNPQQEITAKKEEIKACLTSREQAAAERGNDIEEVDDQLARDKERAAALGITPDVELVRNVI